MGDFIDEIRNNPLILGALALVIGIFIYFQRKSINPAGITPAIPADATLPFNPPQVVNNYASYPIVQTLPGTPGPVGPPGPTGPPGPIPPQPAPKPTPTPIPPQPAPKPTPAPIPVPVAQYDTFTTWPSAKSTMWGMAQAHGESLAKLESLNPLSSFPSHNYNLVYPGQRVRVA